MKVEFTVQKQHHKLKNVNMYAACVCLHVLHANSYYNGKGGEEKADLLLFAGKMPNAPAHILKPVISLTRTPCGYDLPIHSTLQVILAGCLTK